MFHHELAGPPVSALQSRNPLWSPAKRHQILDSPLSYIHRKGRMSEKDSGRKHCPNLILSVSVAF